MFRRHAFLRTLGLTAWAAASAALAVPAPAAAQASGTWQERFWNPSPAEDDRVVPLPCGGALALRPVATPLPGNWLHDKPVPLGINRARDGFNEYSRTGYIAGTITDGEDPGTRRFYIGKYEVTQDQYAAVMEDACPRPSMRGRLPVEETTWFEAVTFARRLTEWLLANAPDALPEAGTGRAYMRLPTETEWEFAARGGDAVNDVEFRQSTFPVPDGLDAYVWYQGQGCRGGVQTVGLKAANPLGLHDILGNVQELVLEPYRMNRGNRLHGQVGGFVTKGGSCLTDQQDIRTALRTEHNFFDPATGRANAPPTTGFRVALAAPVNVSVSRIATYRDDWAAVQGMRSEDGAAPAPAPTPAPDASEPASGEAVAVPPKPVPGTPVDWLDLIATESGSPELESALGSIAASFRGELAAREEIERRAARATIQAGASIIRQFRDEKRQLDRVSIALAIQSTPDLEQSREIMEQRLDITRDVYAALLTQAADDYDVVLLAGQLRAVVDTYSRIDAGGLPPFAERFVRQVIRWKTEGPQEIEVLTQELMEPI